MRLLVAFVVALVAFHTIDGHIVWVHTENVQLIRGAGQLGYPTGTLIQMGNGSTVVTENVVQVVRTIKEAK